MATTENTLRTRQNMEILDVWKNLSSQVNALTKRQVAVFPDTLKPKTQRDMEVEVNVDKSVESLNNALETKLANLEFVLKNDAQLGAMARTVVRPRPDVPEDGDAKEEEMPQPPPLPKFETSELRMTKEERKITDRKNAEIQRQYEERVRQYNEQIRKMREEALRSKAERSEGERKIEERLRGEQKENIKLLPFQNSYQDIINTGSIVSLWNTIVRYYQKQGLSKQSQEMVKTKVQDLIPNLEAIVYGLGQAVDVLFADNQYNEQVGLKILELLRTQSVYQLVKRQIDTSTFELVSVPALETAFKNIFAELSEERRELLDELSNRETGSIATRPIRKIPTFSSTNFEDRLRVLSDELGIDIRSLPVDLTDRLKQLNKQDFEKYAVQALQEIKGATKRIDKRIEGLVRREQLLAIQIGGLHYQITYGIPNAIRLKEEEIAKLESDEEKGGIPDPIPEIQVGDEPQPPNMADYINNADVIEETGQLIDMERYREALQGFQYEYQEYLRRKQQNEEIKSENETNQMLRASAEEKAEKIAKLGRDIRLLRKNLLEVTTKVRQLEQEQVEVSEENRVFQENNKYFEYVSALDDLTNIYADEGKLQLTKGRGKPVDSRGLAGYGNHYGAEDDSSEEEEDSESESDEEDPLAFDDRRNDSYYSRPARRR